MDINAAAHDAVSVIKKNWKMIILLLLFTVGMLIGATAIKKNNPTVTPIFENIFNSYMNSKKSQSVGMNFLSSFAVNMAFLILSFILGLCAIGTPLIAFLPIIKGIGIGMLSGYMYSCFMLKGLGYCVLIVYPGLILAILALIMSCNVGMSTSYDVLLSLSSNKTIKGERSLKLYCIQFIAVVVMSAVASIIDAVTILLFSGLFDF